MPRLAWRGCSADHRLCYLTSTYRRSPRFVELALPLLIGVPLLAVGGIGWPRARGCWDRTGRSAACRATRAHSLRSAATTCFTASPRSRFWAKR